MKRCSRCENILTIDRFSINKTEKDGLSSICKKCTSIKVKEYWSTNRDILSSKAKQRYKNNFLHIRNKNLINKFGFGIEKFSEILEKQENKCAICRISRKEVNKEFNIDHCHKTGKIRGVLCNKCNLGLGHFKDDIDILNSAIAYLMHQPFNDLYAEDIRYKIRKIRMLDKTTGELLQIFNSVSEASRYIKGNLSATSDISQTCKGINKSAYGYKWEYGEINKERKHCLDVHCKTTCK